jgi:hypothetical protein
MIVAVSVLAATPALADNSDARCQRAFRYVNAKCPELLTGLSCKDTPDKVQAAYDQCHDGGGKAPAAPPKDSKDSKKDPPQGQQGVRGGSLHGHQGRGP